MRDECWILRAPRLNANDDEAVVTRWLAEDRTPVKAGQPIAEIETEKATSELNADIGGVLVHSVPVGSRCPIGTPLAAVGPTAAAAEGALRKHLGPKVTVGTDAPSATRKARALAAAHGVDLGSIASADSTIKERDVARHLAGDAVERSALAHVAGLVSAGSLSPRQLRVARELRVAQRAGLFTTLSYRLDLSGPERVIAAEQAAGNAVSLLHVMLHALGRTLPAFPTLLTVLNDGKIYRYRDVDIAFAVRSPTGELHAPVIRQLDRLSLVDIARQCARLSKSAMRGKVDAKDVGRACFAISLVSTPNVESFVALPVTRQSAILALGARREEVALSAAGGVARPVAIATVTYDHSLCDGVYVAEFCAALDRTLNPDRA